MGGVVALGLPSGATVGAGRDDDEAWEEDVDVDEEEDEDEAEAEEGGGGFGISREMSKKGSSVTEEKPHSEQVTSDLMVPLKMV